ncbi:hypothetical protein HBI70_034830 [Parastagonospora nodorum]|nr:hypothetical protein HBH54_117250 [Parastagonospora nodorum]KAH4138311.1 hypothetical protein HBH45_110970 [Parastagonospora nodorum]KAH4154007.1 hypothetical protein HBH44_149180 [Parastagonospora nodorum]KAH4237712.1 hypothetical protein HBI05_124690 [Parastagonospora nodorum]KAH4304290.1 hypothetical protein HBI01_075190 [Parastagonospora nodorum]
MLSKLRKATRAAGSKLDIRPKPVAKMEGLLALPGVSNYSGKDKKLYHRPAKRRDKNERTALGFRQVCRQVRYEFLPLYIRNLTI